MMCKKSDMQHLKQEQNQKIEYVIFMDALKSSQKKR